MIKAKLKRCFGSILLSTVLLSNTTLTIPMVYASEPLEVTETKDTKKQMEEAGEMNASEYETIVIEQESMEQTLIEQTQESDADREESTQEETDESVTTEMTQQSFLQKEKAEKLVPCNLSQQVQGFLVCVKGNMPERARLEVEVSRMSARTGQEIPPLSDFIQASQKGVYCFTITLCVDDRCYKPNEFDEKVEVSITMAQNTRTRSVNQIEVFQVVDETKEVQKIESVMGKEQQVVFQAEHSSQYILVTDTTYQQTTQWTYEFTGQEERLEIPAKGIYEGRLYGAQGGNSESYEGGKGGFVSFQLALNKADVLTLTVAGDNGYQEGGKGTTTNGGGASKVLLNGELIAVAGGGGGALVNRDGGAGGNAQHSVDTPAGENIQQPYSAGGGAGFYGGKAGFVTYHQHEGEASEQGGCYTQPVYHEHTSACYGVTCAHRNLIYHGYYYDEQGDDYSDWSCANCGRTFVSNTSYGEPSPSPSYGWICRSEGVITSYALGCGMTEQTITGSFASSGGSNFLAEKCREQSMLSGVKSGNGMIEISLIQLDAATLRYENDGSEFRVYHVERGTYFNTSFTDLPSKETDERYSYDFIGWDDVSTKEQEQWTNEQTIQGIINGNRTYQAIYEKIPREYVVTFSNDEEFMSGTKSMVAAYGQRMEEIIVPQKTGYLFAGYYKNILDENTKYFDAYGEPIRHADFTQDTTLFAKWEDPLLVIKSPQDQTIMTGYSGVVFTMEALLQNTNAHQVAYQWYLNTKKSLQGAKAIETGFTNKVILPEGYKTGTYYLFCKVTVTGSVQQKIEKYTDIATIQIEKGALGQQKIEALEKLVTYDGKPHLLQANIEADEHTQVYYSEQKLTADNYRQLGKTSPISYKNAGSYTAYIYVVSEEFEDYAGLIHMDIKKAVPYICLASKNTTVRAHEAQGIEQAKVYGVNQELLETEQIHYTYYTDAAMNNQTSQREGALQTGGAPAKIGTYYVMASVEETMNYTGTKSLQPAMLNILGATRSYTVSDYVGFYDGKPHGLSITIQDNDIQIYFSEQVLHNDNYRTQGTLQPFMYTEVGDYTIYYAVVSKLTNELEQVSFHQASIRIKKAIPSGNIDQQHPTKNTEIINTSHPVPNDTLKVEEAGKHWEVIIEEENPLQYQPQSSIEKGKLVLFLVAINVLSLLLFLVMLLILWQLYKKRRERKETDGTTKKLCYNDLISTVE